MRYRTVQLYVTRELLGAFLIAFAFFFIIFFVNQLLLMAERILSKRVPLWDVTRLVFYSIPIIVTYALPFGTLVGALMAVGRLVSDSEIMALRAAGVSLARIFSPMLLVALALTATAFIAGDLLLPLGNIALKTMLRRVIFSNPGVELDSYSVKRYENTVIVTGRVRGTSIEPIVIIDLDEEKNKRVITASGARFLPSLDQKGALALELTDVFIHVTRPSDRGDHEYISAARMVYNILLKDISVSFINPGPAEKSSVDVWREIGQMRLRLTDRELQRLSRISDLRLELSGRIRRAMDTGVPPDQGQLDRVLQELDREEARPVFDRTLQSYLLEFHRKFATPFSCVVFVVFAFPAGLLARRGGRAVGFGVGIVMAGLYWAMLIVSFRFGSRSSFSALLSMWLPNLVVLAAGGALFMVRSRR